MKTIFTKFASVLAFIIGAMAVYAGTQVLLGNDPGYYVIDWLPLYNYTIGILTVFITAVLIFNNSRFALLAAIGTFGLHALVMLILQTAYSGIAASDSIKAMTIRLIVWVAILALMLIQAHKNKANQKPEDPALQKAA